MRIISKFKDYYDFTSKYGFDPKKIYIRKTEEIELNTTFDTNQHRNTLNAMQIIGFCGEIYPFNNLLNVNLLKCKYSDKLRKEIVIHGKDCNNYTTKLSDTNDTIDLKAPDTKILRELIKRVDYTNPKQKKIRFWHYHPKSTYTNLKNNFKLKQIFREYKVPVFYIYDGKFLCINPPLNKLLFQHVIPGWKAFQEIEMYMSILFSKEVSNIKRTNKQIIEQKGFNKKTSFRSIK